jgi:hypothetical protein
MRVRLFLLIPYALHPSADIHLTFFYLTYRQQPQHHDLGADDRRAQTPQ